MVGLMQSCSFNKLETCLGFSYFLENISQAKAIPIQQLSHACSLGGTETQTCSMTPEVNVQTAGLQNPSLIKFSEYLVIPTNWNSSRMMREILLLTDHFIAVITHRWNVKVQVLNPCFNLFLADDLGSHKILTTELIS